MVDIASSSPEPAPPRAGATTGPSRTHQPVGWQKIARLGELVLAAALIAISAWYVARSIHIAATSSLWTDELFSILNYSGKGAGTTLTTYSAANNHVFFNLLNAITPGAGSVDPLRARMWSIVAYLAMQTLVVVEFVRRRLYLAGALLVTVFAVNERFVSLALQARGYGILAFCAVAVSLWLWRYFTTERLRWLVAVGVVGVAGTWTVPTFVFFLAPVLLLTLAVRRRRDVLAVGVGTLVVIVVVYLPVVSQVRQQFDRYAGEFGEQFSSLNDVVTSVRSYLTDQTSNPILALVWAAGAIAVFIVCWPGLVQIRDGDRRLVRVLTASVAAFFAVCLIVRTVITRTTAFVAPALAIAIVVAVVGLLADGRLARLARAGIAAAALVVLVNASTTPAPNPLPLEDWKGAADYIATTFPQDMRVHAVIKAPELAAYLDGRRQMTARLNRGLLDRGQLAVVAFDSGHKARATDHLLRSGRFVRASLPQQRVADGDAALPIYVAPPRQSHLLGATIQGRPAPKLLDRSLATSYRAPPSGQRPFAVRFDVDPKVRARSLLLATGEPQRPETVTVVVTTADGKRHALSSSAVRINADLVTVRLGDARVRSIELTLTPRPKYGRVVLTEAWIYTP